MRMMERFSIIVFSIIVLILSAFTILVSIEIVSIDVFENIIEVLNENVVLTICISILLCLWSIANIFLKSDSKSENSNGVLMENENGSLLITKESISNLVESVIKKNQEIKDSNVKIEFDSNRDVVINVIAVLKENVVIKNTSSKLQENIKLTVKKTTDLDVSSVNLKIKNVEQEKEKKQVVQ